MAERAPKTEAPSPEAARAPRMGLAEVVDMIADALVERIVPRLTVNRSQEAEIVDQISVQKIFSCEKSRYLKAARLGKFKSYRHGKRVFARRADVEAWLNAGTPHARPTTTPTIPGASELDDLVRRKLGLKTRGGRS